MGYTIVVLIASFHFVYLYLFFSKEALYFFKFPQKNIIIIIQAVQWLQSTSHTACKYTPTYFALPPF